MANFRFRPSTCPALLPSGEQLQRGCSIPQSTRAPINGTRKRDSAIAVHLGLNLELQVLCEWERCEKWVSLKLEILKSLLSLRAFKAP